MTRVSAAVGENIARRQRLDDEHRPLVDTTTGQVIASYGPSLITVIFNVETLVDATLFFIAGAHTRYHYVRADDSDNIHEVRFVNPRVPTFFAHLLPQGGVGESAAHAKKPSRHLVPPSLPIQPQPGGESRVRRRGGQRARKRCAFFTMLITRTGRPGEPPIVHLAADVKLFHYTAHVCGLRDADDARIVMRFIHLAFTELQGQLDAARPPADEEGRELMELLSGGVETRRAFLEGNTRCCSIPLVVSDGDVVMTNMCGRFPTGLNLRASFRLLTRDYPAVLTYLTTMSKSNYLVVTLFEHEPFDPVLKREEMSEELVERILSEKVSYLVSSKRLRSRHRKHTFFIYASGRFIQSSRNNATALSYTERCMKLLHAVSFGIAAPDPAEFEAEEQMPDDPEEEEEEEPEC